MSTPRLRRVLLAPLFVMSAASACSKCTTDAKPSAAGDSSAPLVDGGAAAIKATRLDDLLHFTEARLAVSSKVDNARDHAEHIADGRLDTAWNGKTGNLVGAWFGFRVPVAARVRRIELTVGYVAKSQKGEDLFAMNHRIARVRVLRNDVPLLEAALDPDSPAFQPIVLDAPGGDFRIEVLEVKPGTQTAWRELVISELRVLGDAGAARQDAATIPRVQVGGFEALAPASLVVGDGGTKPRQSASTPQALCASFLVSEQRAYARGLDAGFVDLAWPPPVPSCSVGKELRAEGGIKLFLFTRSDLEARGTYLGVEYGGRTYDLGVGVDTDSHFDPHCMWGNGGHVHEHRIERGSPEVAVFTLYSWKEMGPYPLAFPDGAPGSEGGTTERSLDETRCALLPDGPLCATKNIAKETTDGVKPGVDTVPPLPW